MPRALPAPVAPRFFINLYSPCRHTVRTQAVPLPVLDVSPMPPLPAGLPPFCGLLGDWQPTLTVDAGRPALHEAFGVRLQLCGSGSSALLRPPLLAHPDLSAGEPVVERDPAEGSLCIRWTLAAARVPLTPLRTEFSTFDGTRYRAHRLEVPLDVRPSPVVPAAGASPPPVLLAFHELPDTPGATARVGRREGLAVAVLGGLAGFVLAWLARRRDFRRSPQGIRHAAIGRLRRVRVRRLSEMPPLYQDLRLCFGLPAGASASEIEAAAREHRHGELADELQAVEQRRFDPSASPAVDGSRLGRLLRRLSALSLLAALATIHGAPASAPGLPAAAEEAFRRQDFAEASRILMAICRRDGQSPAVLMDLGNAFWFTGRHVEALALYERALRLAPRSAEVRGGVNWLRRAVLADAPETISSYPRRWRDWLCPGEWFFLSGLLAGLGAVAVGWWRWWRRPPVPAMVACAVVVILCLSMAAGQRVGPYRPDATARLTEALTLRAAPAESAEAIGATLPAGALVIPGERRAGWVLVRTAATQGWVPEVRCALVW